MTATKPVFRANMMPFRTIHNTMKHRRPQFHKPPKKNAKRVKFACVRQYSIYKTKEDNARSWYSHPEYIEFDAERKRTVAAVHEAQGELRFLDPAVYTISGLEHHLSRQQAIARKMQNKQHVWSVLKQQHYNRCGGVNDPLSIRHVSEMFSKQTMRRAHLKGVLDHTLTR